MTGRLVPALLALLAVTAACSRAPSAPPPAPTVALPDAYVRAGATPVSVVLGDGAMTVNQTVEVDGEAWLQVFVRGTTASLRKTDRQPDPRGR